MTNQLPSEEMRENCAECGFERIFHPTQDEHEFKPAGRTTSELDWIEFTKPYNPETYD